MNRIALLAHGVRAAERRQLVARAMRRWRRSRFPLAEPARLAPVAAAEAVWRSPAYAHADAVVRDGALDVLGLPVPFPPRDWALPGEPRLRRFHLQYGDEVLGWARRGDAGRARAAIDAWIDACPPRDDDAWHPYTVSQRIANWVAAATLEPALATERMAASLARQAERLARNVEHDVLGNHLVANARSLVLAGRALDNRRLLEHGVALLAEEVPRQVLSDGGHYERSPVYHELVLRDLVVSAAAAETDAHSEAIDRMRRFAAALRRPDGAPAPFNDAPLELAPGSDVGDAPSGTSVFPETGYVVVRDRGTWLAFDCGPPAPPFLPAHAHGDALSFQLWRDGAPVVVDPGTYTYEPGPDRDRARSTRSHATVTVGGREQFALWGAFRSGPLPSVRLLSESPLTAEARYAGVVHRRTLVLEHDGVRIVDETTGDGAAEARLPLARELPVEADHWETGWVSERLYERRPIPVAVRRVGEWRLQLPGSL